MMSFGAAINELKLGRKVARSGWNGKGMWLYRVYGVYATFNGTSNPLAPFIVMKTAQGEFVPWLASQSDVLAEDWVEIFS